VVSQARSLTVENGDAYEMACTFLQIIVGKKKQVEEVFSPIVKKAHEAHKEAVAQMKKFMDPLNMAELEVKSKVSTFRMNEERKRREEEVRQQEISRKEHEERAIAEAAQLEAAGEKELADIVLQNAAEDPAPVVVVASSVPKAAGISGREIWKWRFAAGEENALRMLVKAAAEDERLLAYLMVNETAVGATARTQKGLMKVPGIEAYKENTISIRA
jgi:hypothetical protein